MVQVLISAQQRPVLTVNSPHDLVGLHLTNFQELLQSKTIPTPSAHMRKLRHIKAGHWPG